MTAVDAVRVGTLAALACPALVLAVLGVAAVTGLRLTERVVGNLTIAGMVLAFGGMGLALLGYVVAGAGSLHVTVLPVGGKETFAVEALVDRRGLWFALLAAFVCAVAAVFAHRYMHREPGYYRYFAQFNVFCLGILLISLAGTTTLLFAGWEFIGMSSALLVGFFHERPAPVANALRVFVIYRLSDAAMFAAVLLARHELGVIQLDPLFVGAGSDLAASGAATAIALLLVVAAAGKSAQLPFSGWLPRAMEGPTPSSAVFYGALSIHAGAFVLLRAGPLLEAVPAARLSVVAMGAATALFATLVGRVQTDVKSALAFASLTQVSVILVEIGLGLYDLAMIHMTGHALLRLSQFLRAPSVLRDFHETTNAAGGYRGRAGAHLARLIPSRVHRAVYRLALERGSLDGALDRFVVRPVVSGGRRLDDLERRWCALCARQPLIDRRADLAGRADE